MSRRNFLIRSVTTVSGDIAVGYAMAAACIWVIQSASLGLFLGFVLWLLTILLSLTLSQHLLHPAVAMLLSDRKLDQVLALSMRTVRSAVLTSSTLWTYLQQHGFNPQAMTEQP